MDITPHKQCLNLLFSGTKYHIDFYQREYKWNDEPVKILLKDIMAGFNSSYMKNSHKDPSEQTASTSYPWYYLSTYVTNTVEGKVYIVDGQQRITTLTLILISLFRIAEKNDSALKGWIQDKIAGQSGFKKDFWMFHENETDILEALLEGKSDLTIDKSRGTTAQNLFKNFNIISAWMDKEFKENLHKYETFVFYFMYRLVLVNLSVEQADVPMVFEVINDRGIKLKSHEILKGKLLGQINKNELISGGYNDIWDTQVSKINEDDDDEIDEFFTYFLKGKFANSRGEGQKFDSDYHKSIFQPNIEEVLQLERNEAKVKYFISGDFKHYTEMYKLMLNCYETFNEEQPYVFYNKLNDIDVQFMLLLSASSSEDSQEKTQEKIYSVSKEVERLFSLLQLQGAYDSNSFHVMIYNISTEIREQDTEMYRGVFDKYLVEAISESRGIDATSPFSYQYFKDTGIALNKRFKRYYFSRVDKFISDNANVSMKHPLEDLVLKTGPKNGFHIEHILSHNKDNQKLFSSEEEFERERNRLGAILILKGRDNISSNNEIYKNKLQTYANSLYWNESLREDFYKSKLDTRDFISKFDLSLKACSEFGAKEVEIRHKTLFEISKHLWV